MQDWNWVASSRPFGSHSIWFIKYSGLTRILLWIMCVNIDVCMVLIIVTNEECLTIMMEVYLLILLKIFGRIDYKIQVIWLLSALITHNHTPQSIKCLYLFSYHLRISNSNTSFQWLFIRVALVQYEKHYTIASHPVGATPTLCVQVYLQIELIGISAW